MKLKIIKQDVDLEALKIFIDLHFACEMRIIREEMSLFPQYVIRPKERTFIPEIWKYRIVQQNGKFNFGKLI
jgi:hypothetical protein